MHATCLVCTLKRSPEPSNAQRAEHDLRERLGGGTCSGPPGSWH